MTTTDPFTDAAAWQAEEDLESYLGTEDAAYGFRDGFARGAEWARDYLAQASPLTEAIRAVASTTQLTGQDIADVGHALARVMDPEPTDAEVETAARAIFEVRDDAYDLDEWDDLTSSDRERYVCDARAALSAARSARRDEEKP